MPKITIDVSEWYFDGWIENLSATLVVEKTPTEITIGFNDSLEEVCKTITKEAIESFLNSTQFNIEMTEKGLLINDESLSGNLLIPWEAVHLKGNNASKLQGWLEREHVIGEER